MDRRRFLTLSAVTAAYSALPLHAQQTPPAPATATSPGGLRFIFFTDTHLQPELSAAQGTAKALAKIKSLKPAFCIQGGDHVMDMTLVPRERSLMLLDLYQKTEQALDGIPVHHAIGNHDIFGREPKSGIALTDPLYGKQAFEQRFNTKTYRSFDEKGYHFIILDSIGITVHREFDAIIDPAQLAWLKADLAATPSGTPIIVVSHVPIVSAAPQYSPTTDKAAQAVAYQALTGLHGFLLGNPYDVLTLFEGHNIIAVFQGHTHINETVYWRNIPFITSGAVCGNWWNGSRWGTPEGFTAVELDHGAIHWHYETYGWRSVAPISDPFAPIPHPRSQPLPRSQPDLT